MKKVLLMMLAVLLALPAMAQTEFIQDDIRFYLYNPEVGTPYAIVSGSSINDPKVITIPSSVKKTDIDYSVTAIAGGAFKNCENLTSVAIPNSVTSIGWSAFRGCYSLTSVIIPNSVTEIENSVFGYCSGLTSVTIPNSVTSIGAFAFENCHSLTSVTIPNSVTEIGAQAFYYCRSMTSVIIPNSVTEIGEMAFYLCSSLTSVVIPDSVTEIGKQAFDNCDELVEVIYDTTKPIKARKNTFSYTTYEKGTLNVAIGGLDKAYSTEPWMYFVDIKESDFSGIDEVVAELDPNAPVEVYNLNGVKVADTLDSLPSGLYIVRQGKTAKKVAVK